MKKPVIALLLLLSGIIVFAQDGFRTVESYFFGPGCHYTKYVNDAKPLRVHVTTFDLSNPYLKIESAVSNDILTGKETPSSMGKRNTWENHQVVTAINGDFYYTGTGVSVSPTVIKGQLTQSPDVHFSGLAYDGEGNVDLVVPFFTGTLIATDPQETYSIANINVDRADGEICLYNSYLGSSTQTTVPGVECVISNLSDWTVNDTVVCLVESIDTSSANMAIPSGKSVLSGSGAGADYLKAFCQAGDTIRLVQSFPTSMKDIQYLTGGACKFIENGVDVFDSMYDIEQVTMILPAYYYHDRNPRTAVGFNADSSLLYFVVVDGRQANFSIGMSIYDLATFMMSIGVSYATNFDGGGSSVISLRNTVVNSPSDGSERSVANALMCVSTAPSGDFAHIQFKRDSIAVYKDHTVNTYLSGWDQYYNPHSISTFWDSIVIDYNTELGQFDQNNFTAYDQDGDVVLTASCKSDTDKVKIHIVELNDLEIYPRALTTDTTNSYVFSVSALTETGSRETLDNDIFKFEVMNEAIGHVDNDGRFYGTASGETAVVVSYGSETDTARVIVEIGEGEVVVDEIESIAGWSIDGDSYINMSATSMSLADRIVGTGSKAIKVDYDHTGSVDGMITLACDPVNIYGVPSYILVDVLADSQKNWIYIDLQDARGVDYSVKCSSSLRYNDAYRTQYLDMANLLPSDGDQLYPLKITGIRLRIDDKATTGSMYIDRIRLTYPGWTAIEGSDNSIPEKFSLNQNYPNPFNPDTRISYELDRSGIVSLDVFDIRGQLVQTLYQGYQEAGSYELTFHGTSLPAGIYCYRLINGNRIQTRKMVMIK